ncbi:hypothetical protein SISSUDRAFT_1047629, partial [Sistotremastrum suecicum HHB10207 ss-3]
MKLEFTLLTLFFATFVLAQDPPVCTEFPNPFTTIACQDYCLKCCNAHPTDQECVPTFHICANDCERL